MPSLRLSVSGNRAFHVKHFDVIVIGAGHAGLEAAGAEAGGEAVRNAGTRHV